MRPARAILGSLGAAALSACALITNAPRNAQIDPHLDCESGTCVCAAGFGDCDRKAENGCEADLSNDPETCGGCDANCQGGSCREGRCQPLQLSTSGGTDVAVHGGDLLVSGVPGTPMVVLQSQEGNVQAKPTWLDTLAISGFSVYVAEGRVFTVLSDTPAEGYSPCGEGHCYLVVDPLAATAPPPLCENVDKTLAIAGVTAEHVILRPQLDGGVCRVRRGSPATSPCAVCAPPGDGVPLVAAAAGTRAFWSMKKVIMAWDDGAADPVPLVPVEPSFRVSALAATPGSLYILEQREACAGDESCVRLSVVPSAGGEVKTIDVTAVGPKEIFDNWFPAAMVVTEEDAYFADGRGGLWQQPLDGSGARRLAADVFLAGERLAADEQALYWTDSAAVYRLPRPRSAP